MSLAKILKLLATPPPLIPTGIIEDLLQEHYGISGSLAALISERDQNFYLRSDGGKEYVLKIGNPQEHHDVIAFQSLALQHIRAVNRSLPVPRVFDTLSGDAAVFLPAPAGNGSILMVRLLSYLNGEPLHKVPRTGNLRRNMGQALAKIDLALHDFSHPAAAHEIPWDIKNVSKLKELLSYIPDQDRRSLAMRFLRNYEENVLPALPYLRRQVIHNDLNPHNVLVDPADHNRVTGIIDFGDMVHTYLINDLAIAASFVFSDSSNPLEPVAQMVTGYHAVSPLEPAETDLLFDLIATRFVVNVAITGWRAARYPENRDYILRNNPAAWAGLEYQAEHSRLEMQQYLREQCYLEQ